MRSPDNAFLESLNTDILHHAHVSLFRSMQRFSSGPSPRLDRTSSTAPTPSSTAASQARDDDVEAGDNAGDDSLQDGSDAVNDCHEAGSEGLEERLDL